MTPLTVAEAQAALPDLLKRVEQGEEITITRHGRPIAVVVRPDVLRRCRAAATVADADRIHELLARAAVGPWPVRYGLTAERAEELVAEIRGGRETR